MDQIKMVMDWEKLDNFNIWVEKNNLWSLQSISWIYDFKYETEVGKTTNNKKYKFSINTKVNINEIFLGSTHKLFYKFGDSAYQIENYFTVSKRYDG